MSEVDDIFRRLEERVEYNRHDMGEMGMFIRVGYVKNFLEDTKRTIKQSLAQEANKARVETAEHLHRNQGEDLPKRDFDTDTDEYICDVYIPKIESRLTADKEQADG